MIKWFTPEVSSSAITTIPGTGVPIIMDRNLALSAVGMRRLGNSICRGKSGLSIA
jgi:hypothetical protein